MPKSEKLTVDEAVRRSRAAQGLPPTIDDPAALRAIANALGRAQEVRDDAAA